MVDEIEWPRSEDDPWARGTSWLRPHVAASVRSSAYILGYREAADVLRAAIDARRGYEPLVFPYLHTWRHYVELHLKRIIAVARALEEDFGGAPEIHDLRRLWHSVQELVAEEAHPGTPFGEACARMAEIVDALERVDPRSLHSRYAVQRDGQPSLESGPTHLDVAQFHDVMTRAANLLDCVDAELSARLDHAGYTLP